MRLDKLSVVNVNKIVYLKAKRSLNRKQKGVIPPFRHWLRPWYGCVGPKFQLKITNNNKYKI